MSIAVGASSLLFLLLFVPGLIESWAQMAVWWHLVSLGWAAATAVAMIAAGLDGRPQRVRIVAGAAAVGYVVALALASVAAVEPGPSDGVVWILHDSALGVTCAAMAFRRRLAVLYLLLSSLVVGLVRWSLRGPGSEWIGMQNGVQSVAFCIIFLVMVLWLLRAGRSADRAMAAARRENEAEAQRRARREVAERIDALIHDRVLATLLLAGRARSAVDRDVAARSAADALEALEQQRDDGTRAFTPTQFVWTAQGLVRDLDPETQFGYELEGDHASRTDQSEPGDRTEQGRQNDSGEQGTPGAPGASDDSDDGTSADSIPGEVADTLAAAMLEALRNSLRHADRRDRATTRAVHIVAGPDRMVVTVLDDGAGFDLDRVDTARLGIASSIRGRMRAIGGYAQLASVVGQGTRVALTWDRARAAARSAAGNRTDVHPWGRRGRTSPLDLDFWIGPPPGDDVVDDLDVEPDGAIAPEAVAPGARASGTPAADRGAEPVRRGLSGLTRTVRDGSGREARARRRLAWRIQREPLLFFAASQVVSNVLLVFMADPVLAWAWPNIAALALYTLALALVVLPSTMPIRLDLSIAVVVAVPIVSALMSAIVPPDAGYFAWHAGSNTLLLLALAMRGRIGMAWIGMLGMVVMTWAVGSTGVGETAFAFAREAAVLLVGSVVSLALRRTISRTLSIERARDERAAREAAHIAGVEEQELLLRRFERSALPVLREISAGEQADESRRLEWLAVEADLRDRIRARALDVEPLRGAVQRARERGVRVVLLADAGGRPIVPGELARAAVWATGLVDAVAAGDEVTLRLRASGDSHALTVVAGEVAEFVLGTASDGGRGATGAMDDVDRGSRDAADEADGSPADPAAELVAEAGPDVAARSDPGPAGQIPTVR